MPNDVDVKSQNPSEMRKKLRMMKMKKQMVKQQAEINRIKQRSDMKEESEEITMSDKELDEARSRYEPAKPNATAAARRKAIEASRERQAAKKADQFDDKPQSKSKGRMMGGTYGYGDYDVDESVEVSVDMVLAILEEAGYDMGEVCDLIEGSLEKDGLNHNFDRFLDRFLPATMSKNKNVQDYQSRKQTQHKARIGKNDPGAAKKHLGPAVVDKEKARLKKAKNQLKRLPEAKTEDKPPFDPDPKRKGPYRDRFGNMVKRKNLAKHLAKKAMTSVTKEETDVNEASKATQKSRQEAMKMIRDMERKGKSELDILKALAAHFPSIKEERSTARSVLEMARRLRK